VEQAGLRLAIPVQVHYSAHMRTAPDTNQFRIILASSSPRRRELLSGLGLTFEVIPSEFDESALTEREPALLVERLSYCKAAAVARDARLGAAKGPNPIFIIGADTVVVLGEEILGKPETEKGAMAMLQRLQGRSHVVYTGVTLLRVHQGITKAYTEHERTTVFMQPLSEETIHRYVQTGEPMDKAGSYAIQGRGATFVTAVHGDYFNVVGLPLHRLSRMFAEGGIEIV
jgi:septum formation protein